MWGTVTVIPKSESESTLRIDLFGSEDKQPAKAAVEKWRWFLEQEMTAVGAQDSTGRGSRTGFSYECGGEHRQ